MRFRGLLCAALLVSSAMPAAATMRIAEDRGGQIGHYLQTFAMVRSSGENVVVDGNCLSACTLVLGIVPRERICATRNARFGFHAAWMPGDDGRPVSSPLGTQALWNIYPGSVRRWITRHGGLSRHMIYLQGNEMHSIVHSCARSADVERTNSIHRAAPRRVRYDRASAASDRR